MSILEAMMAGKPVVATDVGEARHMVRNGETGVLVPPRDGGELASAIRFLAQDKTLRERMGRAGLEFVGSDFTTSAMVKRYEALYLDLLRD